MRSQINCTSTVNRDITKITGMKTGKRRKDGPKKERKKERKKRNIK
jgi:hypothetical protein